VILVQRVTRFDHDGKPAFVPALHEAT
jgi:hypothetical protein